MTTGFARIHPMLQELLDEIAISRPAAAFSYTLGRRGTERFDKERMLGVTFDRTEIDRALAGGPAVTSLDGDARSRGHGTHVASIAAGNGQASGGRYQGVAPRADLAVVRTTFRQDAIAAGVDWIFRKAGDRPAVVNLSLGSHDGPHNGTGDFDVLIAGQAGDGKIIVVSAGNEGSDPIHAGKELQLGERWVADFSISPVVTPFGVVVGTVHIEAYHAATEDATTALRTPYGDLLLPRPVGDFEQISGNAKIRFTRDLTVGGDINYSLVITFPRGFSPGEDGKGWSLIFTAGKAPAAVHAWVTDADNGGFTNFSSGSTVGEPATADDVIAVAAHCTKKEWDAVDGTHQVARAINLGDIAYFSSVGPTRDGRQRPDLSAPGFYVMAALPDVLHGSIPSTAIDPTGKYQVMAGTSMSCPHVAGVIALLLEKEGKLSPGTVRARLHGSASRPGAVGWDPRWGMGKLDLNRLFS
ncbi:MAG: S8 family serine peptidase [Candidatus Rokubacteria bacterium]|nr:S8 family serine peptidase [Candidatus Rokubacteria bacterium]